MPLFEILFRATYNGGDCGLSRKFPSLKMFFWCNKEHDVIEMMLDNPSEYALFIKEVPKPDGMIEESSLDQSFHIITKKCTCMSATMSIPRLIGDLNILHVSPSMMEKGWEYHRIIAFGHEDLEELMRRLEDAGFIVEILRKAPLSGFIASSMTINAGVLFSSLTDKQIDALLTAHRNGYYKLPRNADVKTIAAKRHVPRTTFSEHLMKAENKLVTALIPYVQLFAQAPEEKRETITSYITRNPRSN